MEELIHFRSTIDSLSHKEFLKFVESQSQDFWANFMFSRFHDKLKYVQDTEKLNDIISSIRNLSNVTTEIIRSRENENENKSKTKPKSLCLSSINLDTLPNVLISHISSFLLFKSLLYFEKTCRSIFIGTRSPLSLQIMNEKIFNKCWSFSNKNKTIYNWIRFKSIKQLTINMDVFYERSRYEYDDYAEYAGSGWEWKANHFKLHQLPIWSNINILRFSDHFCFEENNADFFERHLRKCNVSNIKQISNVSPMEYESLSYFENLEYLQINIDNMLFDKKYMNDDCKKFINYLIGIAVKQTHKPSLIRRFDANMMESYHQNKNVSLGKNVKFPLLKEVCLTNSENIDFLFNHNNSNDLERIHLNINDSRNDKDYIQVIIPKLFAIHSVNYVCIDTVAHKLIFVLDALNKSLSNTLNNKSRLKIRIICKEQKKFQRNKRIKDDISNHISMILNNLNRNGLQFMLICDLTMKYQSNRLITKFIENQRNKFIVNNEVSEISFIAPTDYNKPTKPFKTSSYILFARERGPILKDMNNEKNWNEIGILILKEWKALDPSIKKSYNERKTAINRKYEIEMEQYKKSDNYRIYREKLNDLKGYHHKFVISNKQCNINGYREHWLMRCDQCQENYND